MACNSSNIDALATELISKIFICALDLDAIKRNSGEPQELLRCAPLSQKSVPLVVSSVCRKWKIIAESTQPLWQGVSIPRIPSQAKQERLSLGLDVWLARSGNFRPLYILLGGEDPRQEDVNEDKFYGASYASDSKYIPCTIAVPLQEVLLKYMPRCSHLSLRCGKSNYGIHKWTKRLDLHSIQNLKYLELHQFSDISDEGPAPIFRHAPMLQIVQFESRSFFGGLFFELSRSVELPALPYQQLLTFNWNGYASMQQALSIFESAERMQTLTLCRVNAQHMLDRLGTPSPITCAELLYLHLYTESLPFAQSLHFPKIEKMSLRGSRVFDLVFSASGRTLQTLELVDVEVPVSDFSRAAREVFPMLRVLKIQSRYSSNVKELLKVLLPTSDGQFVLQQLCRLILYCPGLDYRSLACLAKSRLSPLDYTLCNVWLDPLPSDKHELLKLGVKHLNIEAESFTLYVHDHDHN